MEKPVDSDPSSLQIAIFAACQEGERGTNFEEPLQTAEEVRANLEHNL